MPEGHCNTYMRVEREVQVLSELGDRGATPVLEHMQVGLALILPTHTQRGNRSADAVTTASHFLFRWRFSASATAFDIRSGFSRCIHLLECMSQAGEMNSP